jgi:hypothetical protein
MRYAYGVARFGKILRDRCLFDIFFYLSEGKGERESDWDAVFAANHSRLRITKSDILHHSQQDLKKPVSQRIIKVFRLHQSQESRFLALVQDLSKSKLVENKLNSVLAISINFRNPN